MTDILLITFIDENDELVEFKFEFTELGYNIEFMEVL